MNGQTLAIDVHGLVKRFDGRTVVDRLSLQLGRGRICGFLGPNGSGNTTTIRLLCGLLTADAGQGRCLGLDIATRAADIRRQADTPWFKSWLEFDPANASGKLITKPDRHDLPFELNEAAIIEFYSQKV